MSFSIRMDEASIELRDGTILRADIYRPNDDAKHPAILFRSFNRAYGSRSLILYDLVNAGYGFVNSEIRGRGASSGEWKPEHNFLVEGPDGYDSVEWIASQKWCDGNVGMFGVSHQAFFEYMAAIEQPPHLRAIAPWTGDFNEMYVPPRTGGAISLVTALIWLPREAADAVDRLEKQGQDVGEMRRILTWARTHPDEVAHYLPFKEVPLARVGRLGELLNWRLNPVSQPELERHRRYEKIIVPCFHECGWYDGAGWSVIENFAALLTRAGSPQARAGQYLVVGPWPHGSQFHSTVGDINYGFTADSAGSRLHQFQIAFYDKYLRGKDAALPRVRYFVMGPNQWRTAEEWPLARTRWQRFYLHSRGNANSAAGEGSIDRDEPGSETPDVFVYNPLRPVPTVGGPLIGALEGDGVIAGPVEQSLVEKRNDVLCYTTPALEEEIEITGPLALHLFASTSARDSDFAAKLVQVYPSGRAYNLAEGIMRARGRRLGEQPEFVKPGDVNEYVITLGQTSQVFNKGHRIRIDITSSNFPQFDRNMNTGNAIGADGVGIPAMQTIYHEPQYASYIDFPVILKEEG